MGVAKCARPMNGWQCKITKKLFLSAPAGSPDGFTPMQVPCGQCLDCRLARSREWAVRCMHEAHMHDNNCFLTLTYDDDTLLERNDEGEFIRLTKDLKPTLVREDAQKFLKRLRKQLSKSGTLIKYFGCGEYGDKYARPHFHFIIFGYDFPDKTLYRASRTVGHSLFNSEELSKVWPFGHAVIGGCTFESAAYVARYCVKKLNGQRADEYGDRLPEFSMMSKGRSKVDKETGEVIYDSGGIGASFFSKYQADIVNGDACILRDGIRVSVPRYYDKLLSRTNPDMLALNKQRRAEMALSSDFIDDDERARRANARLALFNKLMRKYENGEI